MKLSNIQEAQGINYTTSFFNSECEKCFKGFSYILQNWPSHLKKGEREKKCIASRQCVSHKNLNMYNRCTSVLFVKLLFNAKIDFCIARILKTLWTFNLKEIPERSIRRYHLQDTSIAKVTISQSYNKI